MKTSLGKLVLPAIIFTSILVFLACQKDASHTSSTNIPAGKAKLSVSLTDGPYDFQKVLIDIKSIQVLVDTCHHFSDRDDQGEEHEGDEHDNQGDDHENDQGDHHESNSMDSCLVWSDLKINPGVYDLLTLRNGRDTLLGASFIPQGKIKKIKIILGTNNSVMADNITSPLQIRDHKDFVIINVRNEQIDSIAPGNFNLLLDFDLAKSIRFDDGIYWLKPVLRAFCEKNTGTIEGKIRPDDSFGMIKAFNATDTAYALPDRDEDGEFKIRGLKEGTYSVWIQGEHSYIDSTITGVEVFKGKETDLGKIVLHK